MSETTSHIEGRVASLERGLGDLVNNLNNFVSSQREENKAQREEISKVYGALKEMGTGFAGGLEDVKKSLNERGRVTGSFVLMLITTGVSLLGIVGGFVHFYVSNRIDGVHNTMATITSQITQLRLDTDRRNDSTNDRFLATNTKLIDEQARSMASDAKGEAERILLAQRLAQVEQRRYDEQQEELRTLRARLSTPGQSKPGQP